MHPTLYEINTRVWRHRFGKDTRLLDIPSKYWEQLARLGVDYVWLMGVWKTGPNTLNYALEPGLQQEYANVLPDWSEDDVIGSPYAIDRYGLSPELGEKGDLKKLKKRLNKLGLRLMLDFVPNHFHAETSLLLEQPDLFLEVAPSQVHADPLTFYHPPNLPDHAFAHGKDPYFNAWQDTIQVDYSKASTRFYMAETLLALAEQCDGLRCDMAMLPVPKVINKTWGHVLDSQAGEEEAFWPFAIQKVKAQYPDFCFLAEVYWDMEWTLQQQGFDYTYDKRLLDRLHQPVLENIKSHLHAALDYQQASARFLENHDEDRSRSFFSRDQAQAAALIAYTVPGMRFFYQGQWEGRRLRLPVQLGREPQEINQHKQLRLTDTDLVQLPALEIVDPVMAAFYDKLLQLLRLPALKQGHWERVELGPPHLLAWQWEWQGTICLIIINYEPHLTAFRLPHTKNNWRYFEEEEEASSQQHLVAYEYLILLRED